MKKIILLPLLVLMTFINYSQNQELLDESWFVQAGNNSETNTSWDNMMNTIADVRTEITFLNDKMVIQDCCGGIFEMEISYINENEILFLSQTEIQNKNCSSLGIYNNVKTIFNSLLNETIFISIQSDSYLNIKSIIFNHPTNSSFIEVSNSPIEMYEEAYPPYWGHEPPNHLWSLTAVHYQGESFELPYGAALTDADIYEGTFTISLCGEILAAINSSWYWDVEESIGPCFISCGILENTTGVCEPVEGYDESYLENFKQNVFNFLNDNSNQTMEYEFTFGSARKLVIEDFSQNKLIFYSNDSYLNTTDYNLSELKIYPNPVSEILFIENGNHEIAKMSLYDINGKLLQTLDTSTQEIDVRNLNNGLYFLVLESATGETVVRKFLKR